MAARASSSPALKAPRAQRHGISNDNLAGHELPELKNASRPPAAEAVVHYARFAAIGATPSHPRDVPPIAEPPPVEQAVQAPRAARSSLARHVSRACLGSLLCHVALATLLVLIPVSMPLLDEDDAGDTVSVIILGDSAEDQALMGAPQEIAAEEVIPEESAAEATLPEQAQTAPIAPSAALAPETPAAAAAPVAPERLDVPEPEVLTALGPAETAVQQPKAVETLAPVAEAPVPPLASSEAVAPLPDTPQTPLPRPKPPEKTRPEQPAEARERKPVEKAQTPPKPRKAGGDDGQATRRQTRGLAEGEKNGRAVEAAEGASGSDGMGSAAVARYPGKVNARIRRSVRIPSQFKRGAAGSSVRIRLSIERSGAIAQVSVARSSGFPELDQAVLDGVRRAAPFPPLPEDYSRATWSFTQDIGVSR